MGKKRRWRERHIQGPRRQQDLSGGHTCDCRTYSPRCSEAQCFSRKGTLASRVRVCSRIRPSWGAQVVKHPLQGDQQYSQVPFLYSSTPGSLTEAKVRELGKLRQP